MEPRSNRRELEAYSSAFSVDSHLSNVILELVPMIRPIINIQLFWKGPVSWTRITNIVNLQLGSCVIYTFNVRYGFIRTANHVFPAQPDCILRSIYRMLWLIEIRII